MKTCLDLFLTFAKIGFFTFGGGYAMIPLIQKEAAERRKWITEEDLLEIVAIAESTPGPIAINAATFVGIRVAGLLGAVVATLGCVTPSCAIVMTLAYVYHRFRGLSVVQGILAALRPAMIAMIASAGLSLLIMAVYGQRALPGDLLSFDGVAAAIFLAGFIALRRWKPNPLYVMAGSGVLGVILYALL